MKPKQRTYEEMLKKISESENEYRRKISEFDRKQKQPALVIVSSIIFIILDVTLLPDIHGWYFLFGGVLALWQLFSSDKDEYDD